MARIPIAQARLGASGRIGVRASADAFGARQARVRAQYAGTQERLRGLTTNDELRQVQAQRQALQVEAAGRQGLQRALAPAASRALQQVTKRLENDQALDAKRKLTELNTAFLATKAQIKDGSAEDGEGYTDAVLGAWDEAAKELQAGAASTFQAGLFEKGILAQRQRLEHEGISFEIEKKRSKRTNDLNVIIENTEIAILQEPGRAAELMESTHAAIEASNVPDEQKRAAHKKADQRFTKVTVESLQTSGRLAEARKLLDTKQAQAALGANTTIRLRKQQVRFEKAQAKKDAGAALLGAVDNGSYVIDPTSKRDRNSVDKAMQANDIPRLISEQDGDAQDYVIKFAEKNHMVAPIVVSRLNAMRVNGSDDQKQFALQTAGALLDKNSQVFDSYSSRAARQLKDDALRYNKYVELFGDPQQAMKRLAEINSPEFQAKADMREKEAKKLTKDLTEGDLADVFTPRFSWPLWGRDMFGLGGSPRRADAIMAAYKQHFEDEFIRTGDKEWAEGVAKERLKKTYGVSSLLGKERLMRLPPEHTHPPDARGSHAYISEQAVAAVAAYAGKDIPAEDIFIEPIAQTDQEIREGNRSPAYGLVWFEGEERALNTMSHVFRPSLKEAGRARRDEMRRDVERARSRRRPEPRSPTELREELLRQQTFPSKSEQRAMRQSYIDTVTVEREAERIGEPDPDLRDMGSTMIAAMADAEDIGPVTDAGGIRNVTVGDIAQAAVQMLPTQDLIDAFDATSRTISGPLDGDFSPYSDLALAALGMFGVVGKGAQKAVKFADFGATVTRSERVGPGVTKDGGWWSDEIDLDIDETQLSIRLDTNITRSRSHRSMAVNFKVDGHQSAKHKPEASSFRVMMAVMHAVKEAVEKSRKDFPVTQVRFAGADVRLADFYRRFAPRMARVLDGRVHEADLYGVIIDLRTPSVRELADKASARWLSSFNALGARVGAMGGPDKAIDWLVDQRGKSLSAFEEALIEGSYRNRFN